MQTTKPDIMKYKKSIIGRHYEQDMLQEMIDTDMPRKSTW